MQIHFYVSQNKFRTVRVNKNLLFADFPAMCTSVRSLRWHAGNPPPMSGSWMASPTTPLMKVKWGDLHGHRFIWWRHQMETFSALLALCVGNHWSPENSPHKGQWRRALMFSLIYALNKRSSKQSWGRWFEMPPRSLWRHCNVTWTKCTLCVLTKSIEL